MRAIKILAIAAALVACGRYRPPIAPEMLAPAAVEDLVVTTTASGVVFSWNAAEKDQRGKELKSSTGYSVERKEIAKRGDETDSNVEFKRIGFVNDKHVAERDKLREEARAQGKVGRTIKSPPEYTKFTFADTTIQQGKTYVYQIVPVNQGQVEGHVGQRAKVVFQGAQSAVVMMAAKDLLDDSALDDGQP